MKILSKYKKIINIKRLTVMALMAFSFLAIGAEDYQLSKDEWSSKLLLETCSDELAEEINYVKESLDTEDEYIAIIPETIGYEYFHVAFKKAKEGMALPGGFVYEFQYWTESDQHMECSRVEPQDFVY